MIRWLVAVVVLVLCGLWLTSCTEWTEVEVPRPEKGEAARNIHYGAHKLMRGLGADVKTPVGLSPLPPSGATLYLTSDQWEIYDDGVKPVQRWVEQGGHLVIPAEILSHDQMKAWVPIRQSGGRNADPDNEDDEDDEDGEDFAKKMASIITGPGCRSLTESGSGAAAFPEVGRTSFSVCNLPDEPTFSPSGGARVLWALEAPEGRVIMRVGVGQGSVTVLGSTTFFDNDVIIKGDNALVAAAVLQPRREVPMWFVTESSRPSLLSWLWRHAWIAFVLGALSLVLALWRGAVRFGPLDRAAPFGRRSMAGQIAGTAQFLWRTGRPALHAAQVRALERVAVGQLRGYAVMTRPERAKALAAATLLDAKALEQSLESRPNRSPAQWIAALELLETARRLLVQSSRDWKKKSP